MIDNDGNKHVRQCFKNCHTPKSPCALAGTLCQRRIDGNPSGTDGRTGADGHTRRRDSRYSLAKVGGKGLFVKELEIALLEKRADIAVHSMKDVPVAFPDGLGLVTICEREDPRDAFVSNKYHSLDDLPAGSIVGTSSLRRQCQLAERRRTSLSVRCAATSAHVSASWTTATMTPLSWPWPV